MSEVVVNIPPEETRLCATCRVDVVGSEWLDHLAGKVHLRRSRKNFWEWKRRPKKRCLLILSTFPLVDSSRGGVGGKKLKQDKAGVITMLQKCVAEGEDGVDGIRNFVTWHEDPYTGVIMFRTEKTMLKVLESMKVRREGAAAVLKIDEEHIVEARCLANYENMELTRILPDAARKPAPPKMHCDDPVNPDPVNESVIILETSLGGGEVVVEPDLVELATPLKKPSKKKKVREPREGREGRGKRKKGRKVDDEKTAKKAKTIK